MKSNPIENLIFILNKSNVGTTNEAAVAAVTFSLRDENDFANNLTSLYCFQ